MQPPCGPPDFDEQDWSKFDFSRWHLDGVTLDAAGAALAGLSEKLFNSEEWQQHFQATLPDLQRPVLDFFKEHSRQLQEARATIAQDFDTRIVAAQRRSDDVRQSNERATAPPVVPASPETFYMVVRVTGKDGRLGLPGIVVQIADPRTPNTPLVEAVTGRDGNAILTVPPELARELDKRDTTLEILDPTGKSLLKNPSAVCVRLNQTETKVVTIPDSPAIEPHKNAALALRPEREALVRNLTARIETLKQERQARLDELDCKLRDNEAIIAELEPKGEPQPSQATPSQEVKSEPGTPKGGKPPDSKKGRKKT